MTSIVGSADTFPEGESERRKCSLFYKLRKMFDFVWVFTASFSLNDE